MSEAGTEARFSSRKRIASALGSVGGSAKREIAELISVVIEIPLYYLALARTELYSTVRVRRFLNLFLCPVLKLLMPSLRSPSSLSLRVSLLAIHSVHL